MLAQVRALREALVPLQLDRDKAKYLAQRMAPQAMAEEMGEEDDVLNDNEESQR